MDYNCSYLMVGVKLERFKKCLESSCKKVFKLFEIAGIRLKGFKRRSKKTSLGTTK